jgi:hypothetical protein
LTDGERAALAELERVYAQVEKSVAGGGCRACGQCCHFRTFGHRLYATRLEALYLIDRCGVPQRPFGEDACGYQEGAACGAREGRALGCRTFFCAGAGGEVPSVHEEALAEISRISERHGVAREYRPIGEHVRPEA